MLGDDRILEALLDTLGDGVGIADRDGVVLRANAPFGVLIGAASGSVIGSRLSEILAGADGSNLGPGLSEAADGQTWVGTVARVGGDPQPRPLRLRLQPVAGTDGRVELLVATMRPSGDDRLGRDPVTGMPNQPLLIDRLSQCLHAARRTGGGVAVIALALRAAGRDSAANIDQLVRTTADRLRTIIRASDSAGRLADGRFGLVLPVDQSEAGPVAAGRVLEAINASNIAAGGGEALRYCMGMSLHPQDGDDPERLLDRAGAACDRAYASGDGIATYSNVTSKLADRRTV